MSNLMVINVNEFSFHVCSMFFW